MTGFVGWVEALRNPPAQRWWVPQSLHPPYKTGNGHGPPPRACRDARIDHGGLPGHRKSDCPPGGETRDESPAAASNSDLLNQLADERRRPDSPRSGAGGRRDARRSRPDGAAAKKFGGLDVLVNNAGIGATALRRSSWRCCGDHGDQLLRYRRDDSGVPADRREKAPAVVNVSSILERRAIGPFALSASKFAVEGGRRRFEPSSRGSTLT